MNIRYRTESFSGTGERDIVDVMRFETFELGNIDILTTLQEGVLKDNPICKKIDSVIDYLEGANEDEYYDYVDNQIEFFRGVVNEINKVTGYDLKYCLWLADKDVVTGKECGSYGKDMIDTEDYDAYEVGPVFLSELGFDGTLYGYEKFPEPLDKEIIVEPMVRPLTVHDLNQVEVMDEMSGNDVSQWVTDLEVGEQNDYSWGMFLGNEMIGYCTIGGADDVCDEIKKYPGYNNNSLLLSDVYIKPEFRGNGYGSLMVDEVIKKRTEIEKELVFITLLHDGLSHFYEKLDFRWCYEQEYLMVRDERVKEKSLDEKLLYLKIQHLSTVNKTICVKTLYEKYGCHLMNGNIIEVDNEYYDLLTRNRELACMDGEVCEVINENENYYKLINKNGEQDVEFCLTKKEFEIATGESKRMGCHSQVR